MTEGLKCEKMIKKDDGTDAQGRPLFHHERCNLPAQEYKFSGMLTTATATLCMKHKARADYDSYVSVNGFPKGKIDKKAKEAGYQQKRFEL